MNTVDLPAHILKYFETHPHKTPYLLMDLDKVADNFKRLQKAMPRAHHYYAIKANPEPAVLKRLVAEGGYFEVASVNEIDMCLSAGAPTNTILYGNPLKKENEIRAAFERGIRQFVFDEYTDLEKIARAAPGAHVICRIFADGAGAVSPLTVKFGALPDNAERWLLQAPTMGLVPYGVSFHTGSQQLEPKAWEKPTQQVAEIFKSLEKAGHPLSILDVGGGFPVRYRHDVPGIETFAAAILKYVDAYFETAPLIYTEPGRYMVGDAGFILTEVVQVAPPYEAGHPNWVYLDIGRYGGLVEEKIDYPALSFKTGKTKHVILAGQTCDSNDVLYNDCFNYQLPISLQDGDKIVLAYTGAYTTTYSTTLNGFETLKSYTTQKKKAPASPCIYPQSFLEQCEFTAEELALFPSAKNIKRVTCEEFGDGVIAQRDFKRGEIIGAFTGIKGIDIKQHTLQISPTLHLHDPHFIGYLLHSCDPNSVLDMHQNQIYCIKDIKAGEPLTMDYASTEDVLFRQFPCLCPASNCRMWITGRAEAINVDGQNYLASLEDKQSDATRLLA
ncbi:MAG: SET domain-containing protein-lysine N-methyltransferase [Alphaproteobacteria bacterium]|nr:SET domain-containing protein-lysine N-methyltransferase [Alphaproteobacteria bacterium]